MGDSATVSRLRAGLEAVGGLAAILAAIGYASVRAWLNHVGIRDIATLPLTLYLNEAYFFVSAVVAVLFPIVGALLVGVAGAKSVSRRLISSAIVTKYGRHAPGAISVFMLCLPLMTLATVSMCLPGNESSDVLLHPEFFVDVDGLANQKLYGSMKFALVISIGAFVLWLNYHPKVFAAVMEYFGENVAWSIRATCAVSLIVIIWTSIIIVNVYVKELKFPLVTFSEQGRQVGLCLLVFSTDDEYVFWRFGKLPVRTGAFVIARRSEVKELFLAKVMSVTEIVSTGPTLPCSSSSYGVD
jgi:hypothetical protein